MLNKEFKRKDVERMRNLIKGNVNESAELQVGYTAKREDHKEGDIWEEGGKKWTIKDGIKQTYTKLDKAKKEAKSNLKTILTSQRPIPSSWRKRRATEGKTRYDLYMSKIDDKTKAEEMEIENIYQKRLREMNFAISKFRNQFDKDPFLPPMDTDSSVSSQIRPSAESKIPQLQY